MAMHVQGVAVLNGGNANLQLQVAPEAPQRCPPSPTLVLRWIAEGRLPAHATNHPPSRSMITQAFRNIQVRLGLPTGLRGGWNPHASRMFREWLLAPVQRRFTGGQGLQALPAPAVALALPPVPAAAENDDSSDSSDDSDSSDKDMAEAGADMAEAEADAEAETNADNDHDAEADVDADKGAVVDQEMEKDPAIVALEDERDHAIAIAQEAVQKQEDLEDTYAEMLTLFEGIRIENDRLRSELARRTIEEDVSDASSI